MKRAIINSVPLHSGLKFNYNCPTCGEVLKLNKIKRVAGEVNLEKGNIDFTRTHGWLYIDVLCDNCSTLVFIDFFSNRKIVS